MQQVDIKYNIGTHPDESFIRCRTQLRCSNTLPAKYTRFFYNRRLKSPHLPSTMHKSLIGIHKKKKKRTQQHNL
ncbi:hypothetical protein HanIR_Chr13g0663031 [Helianthus annuus]|nr:hypothetical protein HanIR_Chr13g0663031 [Helianthus annuus]